MPDQVAHRRLRHRRLVLPLLLAIAASPAAMAMQSCNGTVAATALQPIPDHPTVGLDVRDDSADTQKLAQRFNAGLRLAGVAVGSKPNVVLYVTGSTLDDGSGRGGGSARTYSDLSVFNSGKMPKLPPMPSEQSRGDRTPPSLPMLSIKAQATVSGSDRVAWVALIQCKRTGHNDGQLATELGQLVGGILGKRVENTRL
nr:hypothetical protein [uncultured Rhodopila sp.]